MNSPSDESSIELKAPVLEVAAPIVTEKITLLDTEPRERGATALWILAFIAVIAALYLGRAFLVPLLFGILVSYTLSPVVDWFERYRIPRALGAICVLGVLVGGTSWMALSLSADAAIMAEQLPETARKLRQSLNILRDGNWSTLRHFQEAADELGRVAVDAGLESADRAVIIKESENNAWLRDLMLTQSALLVTFTAQAPVVLLLTYFLLAAGSHFRRKLVRFVGPRLSQKKDAVRILEEVDSQIQRYLLVMLISNALIAVMTWLAFEMLGLKHPAVWGVAAGVLHFIPYLGTVGVALACGVAGMLQFGSLSQAFLLVAVFLLISGVVGMMLTTWLQGRFARVNPAVLFIALLFFGWLWGAAGLLLGAPLLAIVKVICDRVESLKPVGELLGQ
ncbi:AI-2E family transporter [Nitrosospira multiformis]|uniref:AI-2E family transporter n=1 Tax=Nitrosospira multiformis TaxID=1231 RepID=UPI0008957BC9|nr:AI-2E family transporter [Nitrosospira multiformis]SEA18254.1 Predicted PurR-regulated permease PerM [Nitrosospira multiformis]